MRRRALGVLLATVLVSFTPRDGRADDLRAAAALVADTWRAAGASVERGDTRFLYDGETITLALHPGADEACETVGLIGPRGLSFRAGLGAKSDERGDEQVASAAGTLEMTSCGADPIRFVRVTSEAGRGALETVVARSPLPLETLPAILLDRTVGVLPSAPEPGLLPPLPSPAKRAGAAEARSAREGALVLPRAEWRAGIDGKGEGREILEEGCHRLELFAPDPRATRPASRARLDVDATMRNDAGDLVAHDRTNAPDARLETCTGETEAVSIAFEGAPPGSPVLVTHASSPLQKALPFVWGPGTRARMAAALRPRHIDEFTSDPVFLAQGASGLTPVPFDVEPGGCYVAVMALEHGHAHGVGLRVTMGARSSSDEHGAGEDASAVAFCVEDLRSVRLEVEARGAGVAWGLAAFRVASGVWEPAR